MIIITSSNDNTHTALRSQFETFDIFYKSPGSESGLLNLPCAFWLLTVPCFIFPVLSQFFCLCFIIVYLSVCNESCSHVCIQCVKPGTEEDFSVGLCWHVNRVMNPYAAGQSLYRRLNCSVCSRLPIAFQLVITQRSRARCDPDKRPSGALEGLNGEPGSINHSPIPV